MRTSLAACIAGALGALGGGALVGRWCLGLVLIALSAGLVAYGFFRDDGRPGRERVPDVLTVEDVLRRAERVP